MSILDAFIFDRWRTANRKTQDQMKEIQKGSVAGFEYHLYEPEGCKDKKDLILSIGCVKWPLSKAAHRWGDVRAEVGRQVYGTPERFNALTWAFNGLALALLEDPDIKVTPTKREPTDFGLRLNERFKRLMTERVPEFHPDRWRPQYDRSRAMVLEELAEEVRMGKIA